MKFKVNKVNPAIESTDHKKTRYTLIAFKYSLILFFMSWAIFGISVFVTTHDFRSPVIFQNPIPLKQIKMLSPVASKSAMINQVYADSPSTSLPRATEGELNIDTIVSKIYTLESSNGVNDSCKDKGLVNGYGWKQSAYYWNCYKTHEEVKEYVSLWVKDKIDAGWTIGQSMCYYNEGIKKVDCPYYQKYLSL